MSKILITGGNSFIARTIIPDLNGIIDAPNKLMLDVRNEEHIDVHCSLNNYDIVIHCAVSGGRRTHKDTFEDQQNNLKGLYNILMAQEKYGFKLILFSSGAEYDRRNNLLDIKEGGSILHNPPDYYGNFKRFQCSIVKDKPNIILLRLFNVFSELGMQDSFIHTCINNCLDNKDIEIWEDKFFSFFYGKDLALLINHFIKSPTWKFQEYNVTYNDTLKLSDVAKIIKEQIGGTSQIIMKQEMGKSYHGCGLKLQKLGLPFMGLNWGIAKTIDYVRNYRPVLS